MSKLDVFVYDLTKYQFLLFMYPNKRPCFKAVGETYYIFELYKHVYIYIYIIFRWE